MKVNKKKIEDCWRKNKNQPNEVVLGLILREFPRNTKLGEILVKVKVINELYSTNILATNKMAKWIKKLGIDREVREGSTDIVEKIAHIKLGSKVKRFYSFATKYCSWHNKDDYPIYDSRVEKALLNEFSEYAKQDLKDYRRFKDIIVAFNYKYKLGKPDFKKLDKFLWECGDKILSSGK